MLLAQLEGFVTVARVRNVSRAAEALFVSQPALTARLNRLEEELGQQLLLRTPTGVRLTDAGAAFLPHAQRALAAITEGRQLLERVRRGVAGSLSVGATAVVSTYLLPPVIKRFSDAHPEVHLTVRSRPSDEVLDLVRRGDVHLGLVRDLHPSDMASAPVFDDDLVLVAGAAHALGRGGSVTVAELAREQLIGFERGSTLQQRSLAIFREAGAPLSDFVEVDSAETAKKMVAEGLGVAILPTSAVADAVATGMLREVAIRDAKRIRSRIFAIRGEQAEGDLLIEGFLAVARAARSDARPSLVALHPST